MKALLFTLKNEIEKSIALKNFVEQLNLTDDELLVMYIKLCEFDLFDFITMLLKLRLSNYTKEDIHANLELENPLPFFEVELPKIDLDDSFDRFSLLDRVYIDTHKYFEDVDKTSGKKLRLAIKNGGK